MSFSSETNSPEVMIKQEPHDDSLDFSVKTAHVKIPTDVGRPKGIGARATMEKGCQATKIPMSQVTSYPQPRMSNNEDNFRPAGNGTRKRHAHSAAEQKRRDAIKMGYDSLQNLVPGCNAIPGPHQQKISKAQILQKSVGYAQFLATQKKRQEEEFIALKKEITALRIMKSSYDQIVKANEGQSDKHEVTQEVKFNVFRNIADILWESFRNAVSFSSFDVLSTCVFRWLETHCKPHAMSTYVGKALQAVFNNR